MLSKLIDLTKEDKNIKRYKKQVKNINSIYNTLKKKILNNNVVQDKEDILQSFLKTERTVEELFAFAKIVINVVLGKELYNSQLIAGLALSEGKAIEMKTGEGKTLSAVPAVLVNAYKNRKENGEFGQSYIISTNSYLSLRDFHTLDPIYSLLGLKSSCPDSQKTVESFSADVLFMTHSFLGFRYLYDNIAQNIKNQFLKPLNEAFVIIDEADSILIDDARAPLSISGESINPKDKYIKQAFDVALQLEKGEVIKDNKGKVISTEGDFYIEKNDLHLTEDGSIKAEMLLEVESLYDLDNVFLEHYVIQCLKAINLKDEDIDYIVRNEKIVLINENTGRPDEGIVLSEGLHQALEVKEGLEQSPEKQTIAKITYQNLFKLFGKISAMSGTIGAEAAEFSDVYGMDTIKIPENKPSQRKDLVDAVFLDSEAKISAVTKKVKEISLTGQPVLVGTISVEQSEKVSEILNKLEVKHNKLNAKDHANEAEILMKAGEVGAVTVVTNMAGRGVDIIPSEEALSLGGLYVIGVERNMTRRFDNQLIGRAGRQGNPGITRFYVSIEDGVLKAHSGDTIEKVRDKMSLSKEIMIESKMISNLIRKAQNTMDYIYYKQRKNIIAFDDVNRIQRAEINKYRNRILRRDETILYGLKDYREEFIKGILFNYYASTTKQAKKALTENLKKYINVDAEGLINQIADDDFDREAPIKVKEILMDSFDKRVTLKLSEERFNDFMLLHFLRIIDENVKEFYASTDMLLAGIGLRALNNKNPVDEYKKESYHLYETLMTSIRLDYVGFIHRITVKEENNN